jgi:hypothetical protein
LARGRTPRSATLSGPSGHAGIEVIDGVHHCPDAVTGPEGHDAVLIRAPQPVGNTKAPAVVAATSASTSTAPNLCFPIPSGTALIEADVRPRSGAEAVGPEAPPAGGWNAPRGAPVCNRREKNPRWRYPSGTLLPG